MLFLLQGLYRDLLIQQLQHKLQDLIRLIDLRYGLIFIILIKLLWHLLTHRQLMKDYTYKLRHGYLAHNFQLRIHLH